jgi:hypothetical protein
MILVRATHDRMRRLRHAAARLPAPPHPSRQRRRGSSVYDMYPDDWGPANHRPENPHTQQAIQASLDLRDNGGLLPDDN